MEIILEDIEVVFFNNLDYFYDVVCCYVLINCLVLNCFINWFWMEVFIEEEFNIWLSVEDLFSIWEFVNGIVLIIGYICLVLIF